MLVGAVSERDVDLLLIEELASSPEFVSWFLDRVGESGPGSVEVISCARSATDSTGESDSEVFVRAGAAVLGILVENKIHAAAQPRQAERYRERGDGYVQAGRCGRYVTVLIAPETYLRGSLKGFDRSVSYEELVGWFGSRDRRSGFKAAILRGAIEKAVKGYQIVEDGPVTLFWRRYWERSQALAPELDMKKPGGRPSSSSFVYFQPSRMPKGMHLVHKMLHGYVDIEVQGMAGRLDELLARFGPSLEPGMRITRAGKSGLIRTEVARLMPTRDPEEQLEIIDANLHRVLAMLNWFRRVAGDESRR